jgi:release factor glutamine methyltransferase
MTVLEVIQRGAEFLAGKGIDSPRLQLELLLAHVLQLPRLKLYLNFDRILTESEADQVRQLVKRRGQREPLQHLLGTTCFCGLDMIVNRSVLIPRPETELLAERAWKYCQALSASKPPVVLDYGTGSGCLAIAVARHCPSAVVHASDVSEPALGVAKENAQRHGVTERIRFWAGNGVAAWAGGIFFDLIVSNPPYIPSADIAHLMPEVRDWDPHGALDGGSDGLDFYRRLAVETLPITQPGACLMLEFGDDQGPRIRPLFEEQSWRVDPLVVDYSGRERILIAHRGD